MIKKLLRLILFAVAILGVGSSVQAMDVVTKQIFKSELTRTCSMVIHDFRGC